MESIWPSTPSLSQGTEPDNQGLPDYQVSVFEINAEQDLALPSIRNQRLKHINEEMDKHNISTDGNSNDCSGCKVLRVVVHTNGEIKEKLTIHGGEGIIYHACVESENIVVGSQPEVKRSDMKFDDQSLEGIKSYLRAYFARRANEGFRVTYDSIDPFVDALCASIVKDMDTTRKEEELISEIESCGTGSSTPESYPTSRGTGISTQAVTDMEH